MTILNILEFPDPRLRTVAKPISLVDDKIHHLADDMLETMYQAPGIGLAATQVNIHKQLVVIDISEEKNQPWVFINPQITILDDVVEECEEGCLSVPGFYEMVLRPSHVKVNALDKSGQPFELIPDGILAVCIQHEVDHLNGKLFVDRISKLKMQRIRKKLEKSQSQRL